ncbi:MAG: dockerin type I repeat-containing protein, partial [Planctomycetota bacterium]
EDLNGGCNNPNGGSPSQPISVGETVAGEFWASGGTRDTDWYLLTLTEGTEVTVTIKSSLDCFAAFVGTSCGGIIGDITVGTCPGSTSVCLAAGSYYIVALTSGFDGFPCGGPAGNAYTLAVTGVPCDAQPPVNDLCANATVAVEGANPFNNTFAGTEVAGATCGFGGTAFTNDVWFTFTATQTGDYNFETCTCPAPFDTGIEIYDACPDVGGTLQACNDDGTGCAAFASSLNYGMTAKQTIWVRVAGWGGATGATDLNIIFVGDAPSCGDPGTGSCCTANGTPFCEDSECCTAICAADAFCCDVQWDQICANAAIAQCAGCSVEPPVNDECGGAINLPVGVTQFSTIGASGATPACTKFGNPNVYNDIWYTHQATGDGELVISLCGSGYDTKVAVFKGACDGPLVACNDDAVAPAPCAGTLQSEVRFTPSCGTTYYVSVGAYSATGFGNGTITVTQAGQCAAPCVGDINNDGNVNAADLSLLLGSWGGTIGDINGDGFTNAADLSLLLGNWGVCN